MVNQRRDSLVTNNKIINIADTVYTVASYLVHLKEAGQAGPEETEGTVASEAN